MKPSRKENHETRNHQREMKKARLAVNFNIPPANALFANLFFVFSHFRVFVIRIDLLS
jgi:hypothetical protein